MHNVQMSDAGQTEKKIRQIWLKSLMESDHMEYLGVDGTIYCIWKWSFKKYDGKHVLDLYVSVWEKVIGAYESKPTFWFTKRDKFLD
jgi:hypothetical protein